MRFSAVSKTALKELGSNKLRTALMVIGIVVGIAILTVIVAIGEGAQARVNQNLERMGRADVIMVLPSNQAGMPGSGGGEGGGRGGQGSGGSGLETSSSLTPQDLDALRQVNDVQQAIPLYRSWEAELKAGSQAHLTSLYGVEPGWEILNNWEMEQGSFFTDQELAQAERVVILGRSVAETLFGTEDPTGQSIRLQNASFQVLGVFNSRGVSSGGRDLDDFVVVPATTFSQKLFKRTNYDQILIQAGSINKMEKIEGEVRKVLRAEHGLAPGSEDDFGVRIPVNMIQLTQGISGTMKIFFSIAALISLVVGGIVIMNIMLISVGERTKEIGLRKALGAKKKDIMGQFLAEAVAVSLLGGFFGILVGTGGSWLVRILAELPTVVSWKVILVAALFSSLVGIIFGLQPAKKAAALDPVNALRSE